MKEKIDLLENEVKTCRDILRKLGPDDIKLADVYDIYWGLLMQMELNVEILIDIRREFDCIDRDIDDLRHPST